MRSYRDAHPPTHPAHWSDLQTPTCARTTSTSATARRPRSCRGLFPSRCTRARHRRSGARGAVLGIQQALEEVQKDLVLHRTRRAPKDRQRRATVGLRRPRPPRVAPVPLPSIFANACSTAGRWGRVGGCAEDPTGCDPHAVCIRCSSSRVVEGWKLRRLRNFSS